MLARAASSLLLVVDLQPNFLNPIYGREQVLKRTSFLLECAKHLEIPGAITEQYPNRMGNTVPEVLALADMAPVFGKMTFSAIGTPEFDRFLAELNPSQVVICGIETHICINQTAHHLQAQGREVIIAADAVSARSPEMHDIGLRRLAAAGITLAHSESIVYEWMGTADKPAFRSVLNVVKAYA